MLIWDAYYSNTLPTDKFVGSFWWENILKLLPTYKQHAICKAGIGNSILFWQDKWEDHTLIRANPDLFSFTTNKEISLQSALDLDKFEDLFHGSLSVQAYQQFIHLQT